MMRLRRLDREETGVVGKIIVVWLVVVALVGVAVIDAGSIAFTKFGLADVASTAATQAANAYQGDRDVAAACRAAATSIVDSDPSAKLAKKGCVVNEQTGAVTITVRKQAKTILADRLGFTKRLAKVTATETNGPTSL